MRNDRFRPHHAMQYPSRAELDAWLAREPYVAQDVWKDIEVVPLRMTVRNGKITP